MNVNQLIGLSKKEAIDLIESNGFKYRITREDKNARMGTMDHRLDRVKLQIDSGKVSKASIG